jgi:hypothetical protein
MIKYIILIICIILLIYVIFRYRKEGFEPLNNIVTISDISRNLLYDNSYNFIDTSLNVIHSQIYYPKKLLDVNNIVDNIIVDDISYNLSISGMNEIIDIMNTMKAKEQQDLLNLNINIDNFDNGLRKNINTLIKTTILTYEWLPTPSTDKYTSFKKSYDELISLRNSKLTNPSYNLNTTAYGTNENSTKSSLDRVFSELRVIRQNIYNNNYTSINIDDVSTTNDKDLLNILTNMNVDTRTSVDTSFNGLYNSAFNPPGPLIQKIAYDVNTLNLPDISNSITNQYSYIVNTMTQLYNATLSRHINNLNSYVNNYATNLSTINGYNDLNFTTKITNIYNNVDSYYNSNELRSLLNLTTFKITNDNGQVQYVINDYRDVSLNNIITASLNTAQTNAKNQTRFSTMSNRLYNLSLNNDTNYNTLYDKIKNDYTNVYLTQIYKYIDDVNNDIQNSNSLIDSINTVLKLSCVNKSLNTNPLSKYISKSSKDISSYLDNSSIMNLSYYGTYSTTNTNIYCDVETTNQPLITTTDNLTRLKNYLTDIKDAIDFYNKYTKYLSIVEEQKKYISIKPRLDSMKTVVDAYYEYNSPSSYGITYGTLITLYNNIINTRQFFDNNYKPCIIKRYANDIYNSKLNEYTIAYNNYINARDLNNIKKFFDYFYTNFEIGTYLVIKNYYDLYVKSQQDFINITESYKDKISIYNDRQKKLKESNTKLHSHINNTIHEIMNDTQTYNTNVINQTIENKTNEMINNLNNYTKTMNESKKNAFDYITNTNNLLEKQQIQFDGGNGPDVQLNEYLESANKPFVSSDSLRKGVIDRYKDTSCGDNEFIYCLGGQIDCVDIYGDTIPNTLEDMSESYKDYKYGKTYGKCGSYINKINLSEYSNKLSESLLQTGNVGYYYDLVKCTPDKPWRVGGEGTPITFNDCYADQDRASGMYSIIRNMNQSDFINKSLVYIESDYILQEYAIKFPTAVTFLNSTKAKWVGNQRMYQGVIKSMNKNNLFDIYVPDESGTLLTDIPPQHLRLPNMNVKNTPQLDNLPKGSHPRPICRYGKFTDKCSKGNEPPIDFKSKDTQDLELNKYLLTPKSSDSKYITGANTMDDLYTSGTTISNSNNTLGFSMFN